MGHKLRKFNKEIALAICIALQFIDFIATAYVYYNYGNYEIHPLINMLFDHHGFWYGLSIAKIWGMAIGLWYWLHFCRRQWKGWVIGLHGANATYFFLVFHRFVIT